MRFKVLYLCVAGAILITGSLCHLDVPIRQKLSKGNNAIQGFWPWQVSIRRSSNSDHHCGGSLISKRWVLTAAHCLQGLTKELMKVFLGHQGQTGPNPNEMILGVNQAHIYPRYDRFTHDNDIALVLLHSTVNFTDYIRPVSLAGAHSSIAAGTKCWLTGWGKLSFNDEDNAPTLQVGSLPIVDDTYCRNSCFKVITDNMICAGEMHYPKVDACQGDSGGPLVNKHNHSKWIQSGIVSFGQGCGEQFCPGVYTRVSRYENWIKSHTIGDQPEFIGYVSIESSFNGHKFNSFLFSLSLTFSIIPPFYLF